ncbi:MAG: hypothetical protein KC613_26555, partial [Myxococcales bacterium]|nr:hypothetical protein [Myxococcales bacterium]
MADPIKALEEQLEDLRRAFELYFLGIEKRLPAPHRAEVERVIRRFRPGKDSIARFRYANLTMRLQTLQRYWDRTIKAMEDGTYIRDIQRANRKAEAVQRTEARAEAPSAARQAEAAQAAQAVGDEAEAFLASLRGTPKLPSPPMRGAPVGEPAPPMRGTPVGEPSVPPMRGAPVRSRPSTPAPLRGAPVSELPSTPEAPAPAPSPPMRGAPVGRELPAAPL